jgi:hypothetical protein
MSYIPVGGVGVRYQGGIWTECSGREVIRLS